VLFYVFSSGALRVSHQAESRRFLNTKVAINKRINSIRIHSPFGSGGSAPPGNNVCFQTKTCIRHSLKMEIEEL